MAASSLLQSAMGTRPLPDASRVYVTPGNPHAVPWIRIRRGRRAPAQLSAAGVCCRARLPPPCLGLTEG